MIMMKKYEVDHHYFVAESGVNINVKLTLQ